RSDHHAGAGIGDVAATGDRALRGVRGGAGAAGVDVGADHARALAPFGESVDRVLSRAGADGWGGRGSVPLLRGSAPGAGDGEPGPGRDGDDRARLCAGAADPGAGDLSWVSGDQRIFRWYPLSGSGHAAAGRVAASTVGAVGAAHASRDGGAGLAPLAGARARGDADQLV